MYACRADLQGVRLPPKNSSTRPHPSLADPGTRQHRHDSACREKGLTAHLARAVCPGLRQKQVSEKAIGLYFLALAMLKCGLRDAS